MKPGRAVVIVLGVAVVLGAGAWWWSRGSHPAEGAAPAPGAVGPQHATQQVAASASGSAPLPAQGTPLRLVFDDLSRRAGAGDARAACRLAAELEQCERVRLDLARFDDQTGQQQRMLARMSPEERTRSGMQENLDRMTATRGQELLQASEQCEGAPALSPGARANLWRQAALGGSLAALAQYAVGNAFRTRDTLELLPQLQTYRTEAESLALQAARRGSLSATLALAGAYSPQRDSGRRTYLAQVVTPDPATSLALYLRAQQTMTTRASAPALSRARRAGAAPFQDSIDALRENMSPDQIAQAEALSRQWQQQWATVPADQINGTFSLDGGVSDIAPARCGD